MLLYIVPRGRVVVYALTAGSVAMCMFQRHRVERCLQSPVRGQRQMCIRGSVVLYELTAEFVVMCKVPRRRVVLCELTAESVAMCKMPHLRAQGCVA